MARIVRCPSCAAMHRALASQTQLLCDYCKSWIRCEQAVHAEELCRAGTLNRAASGRTVLEWLERQGVAITSLDQSKADVCAFWQLTSDAGEEILLPATADPHPLLRKLRPGPAPMVASDERDAALELPALTLSRSDAEQAALGAFRDKEPRVATIRLLWFPYVGFRAHCRAGSFDVVHVLGSERPIVEPLPANARGRSARPAVLVGYAAFVAALFGIALLVPSQVATAILLVAMLLVALPVWTRWAVARSAAP